LVGGSPGPGGNPNDINGPLAFLRQTFARVCALLRQTFAREDRAVGGGSTTSSTIAFRRTGPPIVSTAADTSASGRRPRRVVWARDRPRRFPPPWSVEETDACFIVRDANRQALAYVYVEEEPGRRSAARLMTRDEARRIAANIASSP
jgi:hypothetical protein